MSGAAARWSSISRLAVNHTPGRHIAEAHAIVVTPGSLLADLVETAQSAMDPVLVNSSHHQAVARVGDQLQPVAISPLDGTVEAVEGPRQAPRSAVRSRRAVASGANLRFQPALSRALPGICRGRRLLEAPVQRLLSMAITPGAGAGGSRRAGACELSQRPRSADRLAAYGNLLLHWNARLSLTAIRDEAELVERHLMEGVFAAAASSRRRHRARFRLRNRHSRHPHRPLPSLRPCHARRVAAEKGRIPAGSRSAVSMLNAVGARGPGGNPLRPAASTRSGCAPWTRAPRCSRPLPAWSLRAGSLPPRHLAAAGRCQLTGELAVEKHPISRRKCPCFAHWPTNLMFHVEHVTPWVL